MLNGGSPSQQQTARLELVRAGQAKSMPAAYPGSLGTALLPVLRSGSARARLNAAVVLERVASKTASPSLLPAVETLLDDRCDAVALWGVKAAGPLVAAGGATAPGLAAHVATTVKAHARCGAIAEEAYAALLTDPVQPALVDPLLSTLAARTSLYETGVLPPSPMAEHPIPAYLSATCWPQATAAGRMRILAALARFTFATAGAIANGSTDRGVLAMVRVNAEGLEAIGAQMDNGPLSAAAKFFTTIQPDNGVSIRDACKALNSALSQLGVQLEPANPSRALSEP